MFYIKEHEDILKNEMAKLKNEVHIIVFTDVKEENGEKVRRCMSCDGTMSLLEQLSEFSNGKLVLEEKSIDNDIEDAEKFNVTRIPTILFIDEEGKEVLRYLGNPLGAETSPFIENLKYFSGVRSFYEDAIISNLKNMEKSTLKLFITLTCPYCPSVVPISGLFAMLSRGKVKTEIIDINVNQDLAIKYQIQGVPHVMVNEDQHIYGVFSPQDLLEKLTRGKQDFGGMYA
ncbi:MAG: thioredoxin family protein [Promethearchaeota archaeon]